jgi:glyoxylase-like metal-dependent hydrolase (beta-lactamase superfamily II)
MKKKINLKEIINNMKINRNNLTIKLFHFNFIQVNTMVIFDDTKQAMIVDPGNSNPSENEMLFSYIEKEQLQVKWILNTHPHIDHVLGNAACKSQYPEAVLAANEQGLPIYDQSVAYGASFGFTQTQFPKHDHYLVENDLVQCGNNTWKVIEAFGHADGSICFYNEAEKVLIVGDVLFEGGIGRTDLPTGNYNLLIDNIKNKLMVLPDDVLVIPGHADTTTIKTEKETNPYL